MSITKPARLSNGISQFSLLAYASPTFCLIFLVGPAQSVVQGIYTQHFGLKLAELASIIFICRVFDAVTDPLIGYISDSTRRKIWGGRKFMVVIGAFLSIIAVYFLFIPAQQPVTTGYFFVWFMLCYLGWTIVEIPHLSWGSELSNDYKDRNLVFSYRAVFFYLGYAAFLALPFLPIFTEEGYTPETLRVAFWIVLILFPITVFWAIKSCPQTGNDISAAEDEKNNASKGNILHAFKAIMWNRPLQIITLVFIMIGLGIGMQTGVAFLYITSFLGLMKEAPIIFIVSFPAAILGIPLWNWLAKKLGKHKSMSIGTGFTTLTFLGLAVLTPGENVFWYFLILNATIHFVQSSWISIGPSLLGDVIDYDTSVTGADNSATYYAFFTLIRKVFEGVGGGLGIYIAAKYGFEPSELVITEDVIWGMQLVIGYIPAVLFALATIFCLKSPITQERHKEILETIKKKVNL